MKRWNQVGVFVVLMSILVIGLDEAQAQPWSFPIEARLVKVRCNVETDEVGSDEIYVLVTAVNFKASASIPLISNVDTFLYGTWEDFDKGESRTGGMSTPFWGLASSPTPIAHEADVAFIVTLMENDHGSPSATRGLVKSSAVAALAGSLLMPRNTRVAKLINDVKSAAKIPTGGPNFDEHVGTLELKLSQGDVYSLGKGLSVSKSLSISGDGGRYTLDFQLKPIVTKVTKKTLSDTSNKGLALSVFGPHLYMAWAGADNKLNIMRSFSCPSCFEFQDKVTLSETSKAAPALTVFQNKLHLAWTGTDGRINMVSSADGQGFAQKVTLTETTASAPALAVFQNKLYLAWTNTDGKLNVASSANGKDFTGKVTLKEASNHSPAIGADGARLILAWTGTDQRLNVLVSTNGQTFANKKTLTERSNMAPALMWPHLHLAWTGTDQRLNYMGIRTQGDTLLFDSKFTLNETSIASPALAQTPATLGGGGNWCINVGWVGTDAKHKLNIRCYSIVG